MSRPLGSMPVRYPRDAASELLDRLTVKRQKLFASWQGDEESLRSMRADYERVRPLPRQQDLAELLDVAFLASIAQEEGRAVTFTLLYCDPLLAIESQWPMIRFASDLALTVEEIRKLSPACPIDGGYRCLPSRRPSVLVGCRLSSKGSPRGSRRPGIPTRPEYHLKTAGGFSGAGRHERRACLFWRSRDYSRRARRSCLVYASPALGQGIRLSTLLPRPIRQCSRHYRYGLRCLRRGARRNNPGGSIGDDAHGTRQTTIRRTRCVSTDPRVRVVRP